MKNLIAHTEEQKVIETRKKEFSIRKVTEITGVRYDKVLQILRRSGMEEDIDEELEEYMDTVLKRIAKKSRK